MLLAGLLALSLPACALLIRADRDDAEYLELATKYESSVALGAPDGEGVLIAARWILTAAHRVDALRSMKAPRIAIGGKSYEIQSLHPHPAWKKGSSQSDIGLIQLKRAVASIEPSRLYRDGDEGGKVVIIVGHGGDGKKRAGINTVDKVSPRMLWTRVKPPEEASDLQGRATPGDSGGPAFIEAPQGILVAGIGSATEGDWEIYARVSAFVPWIEAVMLDAEKREIDTLLDGSAR
jgi:secreted trypsin-like serine protease